VTDTVTMFERAASNAASMIGRVQPDQWAAPTPCTDWDVAALIGHMAAGTGYLMAALGADVAVDPDAGQRPDEAAYRSAVAACVAALREPGAVERRCLSPAGFEWSVAEAAAGTAMDQLVHTWDLAVAIGGSRDLDAEIVASCLAMFVPQMPDVGRAAGFIGPAIDVGADASPQDRLLGAMGRQP